jgi:chromosomal replication initiation ATPase DnaA
MGQLPLAFEPWTRFRRDDFVAAPANAAALKAVEDWPAWPDRVALLLGPPGAGKSHLAAIWVERAGARALRETDLGRADLPALVRPAVVIDDVDAMAARETALFHLLNIVREEGAFLLLTARTPPDRWGLRTADLLSRLRLAPTATLEAPDTGLMRSVLQKLFADRQLLVDEAVIAYLTLHLDRSLSDARAIVADLDRRGLALGRRVTRAMAAAVLGQRAEAEDNEGDDD